jgi:hypothetical protein
VATVPKYQYKQYSQGFTIAVSNEEQKWIRKIERYPLWYRYAPGNIKDKSLILFTYQMSMRYEWLKSYNNTLIYGN